VGFLRAAETEFCSAPATRAAWIVFSQEEILGTRIQYEKLVGRASSGPIGAKFRIHNTKKRRRR
jgi:hypothetical protein